MTIEEIIAEPLILQNRRQRRPMDREVMREKVFQVMAQAELPQELAKRHPYDVSGLSLIHIWS